MELTAKEVDMITEHREKERRKALLADAAELEKQAAAKKHELRLLEIAEQTRCDTCGCKWEVRPRSVVCPGCCQECWDDVPY